jgi:hypothetical protein
MIILIYVSFVPVRVLHEDETISERKHIYLPHAQTATCIYNSEVKLFLNREYPVEQLGCGWMHLVDFTQ